MSRFERQSAGDKNVKKIRKVISILSSTLISLTFRRRRRKMFNVELRGDTPKSQSCDLHLITRFILFAYRQFTWAGCEWFFWFFLSHVQTPDSQTRAITATCMSTFLFYVLFVEMNSISCWQQYIQLQVWVRVCVIHTMDKCHVWRSHQSHRKKFIICRSYFS